MNATIENFSSCVNQIEALNDSSIMSDVREGPRLNLPNNTWMNQYAIVSKLQEKGVNLNNQHLTC
jgi:hypothetical protein